jgi:hypothetical protein
LNRCNKSATDARLPVANPFVVFDKQRLLRYLFARTARYWRFCARARRMSERDSVPCNEAGAVRVQRSAVPAMG